MPTWGRGGAGNIANDAQISEANKRISADLEASQHAADNALNPATQPTESGNAAYAYKGRGGAGNLFSPTALAQTGVFHGQARSGVLGEGTAAPAAAASDAAAGGAQGHRGRGGAGNYVWSGRPDEGGAARREAGEGVRGDGVSEAVARDVEAGLARPEGVYLRGKGEVRGMGGMGGMGWK